MTRDEVAACHFLMFKVFLVFGGGGGGGGEHTGAGHVAYPVASLKIITIFRVHRIHHARNIIVTLF